MYRTIVNGRCTMTDKLQEDQNQPETKLDNIIFTILAGFAFIFGIAIFSVGTLAGIKLFLELLKSL